MIRLQRPARDPGLFVHQQGSPRTPPCGVPVAKLRNHRTEIDAEWGVCEMCLEHRGELTVVTRLRTGLVLSANIDVGRLAAATLDGVVDPRTSSVALVVDGLVVYAEGDPPADASGEHVSASAPIEGTHGRWEIAVATPRSAVAPDVQAAGRAVVWTAAALVALSLLALWIFTRLERRRHALEQQRLVALTQMEKLAMVGLMSAATAHEINNALTVATMTSALLREGGHDLAENCDHLDDALERLRVIAADLSKFGRRSSSSQDTVSLDAVVADAVRFSDPARKRGPSVEVIGDTDLSIIGSHNGICQVVTNLIINATHAMRDNLGGRIRIRTFCENRCPRLVVEDQGTGLTGEALEHLFDAYFTTKTEDTGTGLGLWISRRLIEQHGGTLAAANLPTGGAQFTIAFPRLA